MPDEKGELTPQEQLAVKGCGQWLGCLILVIILAVVLFFVCSMLLNGDSKCWDAAYDADHGDTVEKRREGARYFGENCTWNERGAPVAK